MSEKISLREIIAAILNEIKSILRQYVSEAETAFKKRLKRLLIISILGSVLMALGIHSDQLLCSYLSGRSNTSALLCRRGEALYIMGITSRRHSGRSLALYIIIRNQLRSPKKSLTKNKKLLSELFIKANISFTHQYLSDVKMLRFQND